MPCDSVTYSRGLYALVRVHGGLWAYVCQTYSLTYFGLPKLSKPVRSIMRSPDSRSNASHCEIASCARSAWFGFRLGLGLRLGVEVRIR